MNIEVVGGYAVAVIMVGALMGTGFRRAVDAVRMLGLTLVCVVIAVWGIFGTPTKQRPRFILVVIEKLWRGEKAEESGMDTVLAAVRRLLASDPEG